MAIDEQVLTEHDLMRLSQAGQRYELIAGELIEMSPTGFLHVIIAGNVYRVLYAFATPRRLGYVCGDSLIYVLHIEPVTGKRTTRIPDVSFIRKGRQPAAADLAKPFRGAPDLAVEVMSPDDSATDLLDRIRHYFTYGTTEVWVLYPQQRELHRHVSGQPTIDIYAGDDPVETAAFFPGLELITSSLFEMPDMDA